MSRLQAHSGKIVIFIDSSIPDIDLNPREVGAYSADPLIALSNTGNIH